MEHSNSTFAERFAFARWYEAGYVRSETDEQFGRGVGRTKGAVSQWRRAVEPPPKPICEAIAERTRLDVGWLMHGEKSKAPEPPEFAGWLTTQRSSHTDDERVTEKKKPKKARARGHPARPTAERKAKGE